MEINIREEPRTVEVWLTRAESGDERLQQQLKGLYQSCKSQKYLVAVFQSGERDVWEAAGELLRYNRNRLAELEVRRERAAEPPRRFSM